MRNTSTFTVNDQHGYISKTISFGVKLKKKKKLNILSLFIDTDRKQKSERKIETDRQTETKEKELDREVDREGPREGETEIREGQIDRQTGR